MYSRNQSYGASAISLPENYDGVAFTESASESPAADFGGGIRVVGSPSADVKMSPSGFLSDDTKPAEEASTPPQEPATETGILSGLLGRMPSFGKLFSGDGLLFGTQHIKLPRIGYEEILLIGIALFLLFNKDGDRECAVMLLLLIFISS